MDAEQIVVHYDYTPAADDPAGTYRSMGGSAEDVEKLYGSGTPTEPPC